MCQNVKQSEWVTDWKSIKRKKKTFLLHKESSITVILIGISQTKIRTLYREWDGESNKVLQDDNKIKSHTCKNAHTFSDAYIA